LLRYHEVLLES